MLIFLRSSLFFLVCGVSLASSGCTSVDPLTASQAPATPSPQEVAPAAAVATGGPMAVLDGWKPVLKDVEGDQKGPPAADLEWALAVTDGGSVYLRWKLKGPLTSPESVPDLRVWLERQPDMVTIDIKTRSADASCEISALNEKEGKVIPACFQIGHTIDVKIPLTSLPAWVAKPEPYFLSGWQTCCSDEDRTLPFDELAESQEVWRMVTGTGAAASPEAAPASGASAAGTSPAAPAPPSSAPAPAIIPGDSPPPSPSPR